MKPLKELIEDNRWQAAQQAEFEGWQTSKAVELELEEIRIKYGEYLMQIAKDIEFNQNWEVLDVGCGPTCISQFLPPAKKTGIDPLAERQNIADKTVADVLVRQGRGETLQFNDKTFDLVICRNVIDHTGNPKQVIREMHRILKNSGYLILASYVYPPFIRLTKNLAEKFSQFRNVAHPHTFTPNDLEMLIAEYFSILRSDCIHIGQHPNDYGKINELESKLPLIQELIVIINNKILRGGWFLKEHCLLLRKERATQRTSRFL